MWMNTLEVELLHSWAMPILPMHASRERGGLGGKLARFQNPTQFTNFNSVLLDKFVLQ